MAKYYAIVYYHNFSIHSSINERQGCVHAVATVNDAAMSMEVQTSS